MGPRATVLAAMLTIALGTGQGADAQANDPSDVMLEPMPPRLSLTDGQVSFWRPGAQDWTQAQLNTPLAPGDALSTAAVARNGSSSRRRRRAQRTGRRVPSLRDGAGAIHS